MTLVETLRKHQLLKGKGRAAPSLPRLCDAGRLVGGLSVSLRATPDEVVGTLLHALGGAARTVKVLDVRTGRPLVMEVAFGELKEKWELEDVRALLHNCNDLFLRDDGVAFALDLGEWHDMLQVWVVPKATARGLLAARVLDEATNLRQLQHALEAPEEATW